MENFKITEAMSMEDQENIIKNLKMILDQLPAAIAKMKKDGSSEQKIKGFIDNIAEKIKNSLGAISDIDPVQAARKELPKLGVQLENLNEGKRKKGMTYEAALREIDAQSAIVAMEAKIEKLKEMATKKKEKMKMVQEDENLSELIDKRAMSAMMKEIKQIEKMQEKLEKLYEKKNGKKMPEMVDEDEEMNEGGYGMSKYEEDDDKPSMEEEIDEAHCNTEEDDTDSMNEEFLRMQKLAGVISEEEYKTQVDELFGFGKKKRARSGGSDSKGFSMFAYGKDGGKRNIGSGKTAQEARRAGDFQNYRRRYAVDKFEVVNNDTGEVVDTMKG